MVVGLGLIGTSWAQAFHRVTPHCPVLGIDPALSTPPPGVDALLPPLTAPLAAHSWVVLAAPLSQNCHWLQHNAAWLQACWVTDVGSCKRRITALGDALLPDGRFLGGHPMAGKAQCGAAHAEPNLFDQRPYFLCPTPQTHPAWLDTLANVVAEFGAQPERVSPQLHDQRVAATSHLPQLYSLLLAGYLQNQHPGWPAGAGPALAEQLRLCGSSATMWQDIFEENWDNVQSVAQGFFNHGLAEVAQLPQTETWFQAGTGALAHLGTQKV